MRTSSDGAAGREIEPAEQFLPARLGGGVDFRGGFVARLFPPGGDGLFHAGRIGAEALGQRLEKGDARSGGQFAIAAEDLARQRDAGGLAAAGQEILAQLDQALGAGGRIAAPVARQQRAAALGNGLQQFPEKRGVHLGPMATPIRWSGNHVAISGKKHKITIANIIHRT